MMLAIYDFDPRFCPNCGEPAIHHDTRFGDTSYKLRNSFTCCCGVSYQKASAQRILQAAEECEGDLREAPDRPEPGLDATKR